MRPVSSLKLYEIDHATRAYLFIVPSRRKALLASVATCQCWNFKLRYIVVSESSLPPPLPLSLSVITPENEVWVFFQVSNPVFLKWLWSHWMIKRGITFNHSRMKLPALVLLSKCHIFFVILQKTLTLSEMFPQGAQLIHKSSFLNPKIVYKKCTIHWNGILSIVRDVSLPLVCSSIS